MRKAIYLKEVPVEVGKNVVSGSKFIELLLCYMTSMLLTDLSCNNFQQVTGGIPQYNAF